MSEFIITKTIDAVPQVNKNLVEVVRCKDCKFYEKGYGCEYLNVFMCNMDDWFCADGVRKDG